MALISTTALPLGLTHPTPAKPPRQADIQELFKAMIASGAFTHAQELMIEKFYNDIHRVIEGRVLVGLLSDRPTAGTPGRTFFAMDTGQFFVDDGTTWTQIGGGSGTPINFNAESAGTFNLPAATGSAVLYVVKKIDATGAGAVAVTPNGSDTIDGTNAAVNITLQYDVLRLYDYAAGQWLIW